MLILPGITLYHTGSLAGNLFFVRNVLTSADGKSDAFGDPLEGLVMSISL
jgi:hypothetical protein